MNIETISLQLSASYQSPLFKNKIEKLLKGELQPNDVVDYKDYENLYKLRHDCVHYLICNERGLDFGERRIIDIIGEINHPQYHLVKNQTPDIVIVNGKNIKITEITVSTLKEPEMKKISKYSLLIKILEQVGFEVEFEVIAISATQGLPDRNSLIEIHHLSLLTVDLISEILLGFGKSIQRIHLTENGTLWQLKFRDIIADDFKFDMSDDEIINYFNMLERKPFNNVDDLKFVLTNKFQPNLSNSDNRILHKLTNDVLNDPCPYEKSDKINTNIIRKYHDEKHNNTKLKNISPLPYIRGTLYDSSERRVYDKLLGDDLDLIRIETFKGEISNTSDSFFKKVSEMNGYFDKIKLNNDEKISDALDGPGRKKFLSKSNCPNEILIKEKEDTRLWLPLFDNDSDIENISFKLSEIDNKFEMKNINDLLNARGPGLDYVRFFQSIMREVALNANRQGRNKRYILKPTTVDGVFILIYPGPRLRTGENLSQIFFKILISKRVATDELSISWIFKKMIMLDKLYHTKWISTDAHRLDHYIRCYDKILMAYSCYMMYGRNDLLTNIQSDQSNTLGMIILTYLEDKRCTSKMLQDVRFVVMSILSMFQYWDDILDKFTDPNRSCLQVYYLRRILKYIDDSATISDNMIKNCKFGRSILDPGTNDVSDKLAGSSIILPRILTRGNNINFQQMLCEMYFSMLFNKNQDDPTHSSHQILTKILEGEENLDKVKSTSRLHTGLFRGDNEDINTLLKRPCKNQFSRRIIMIASKLQSLSDQNNAPGGNAYLLASQNKLLNKTFDEFATYKSSALLRNIKYDGTMNTEFNDVGLTPDETNDLRRVRLRKMRETSKDNYENQNPRVRCISSIIAQMSNYDLNTNKKISEDSKEEIWRSFDLLKYIKEINYFQVFKKNQIGGVREIIILPIRKRILINIMETFSRLICKEDSREMLTHGSMKFSLFRDMMRDLKKNTEKRIIMNYNFDKTKWGPSFMPIQFLYMFLPFKSKIPNLFRFILVSLMNHTNKRCLLPEKLVRSWVSDPFNMKHYNPLLQKLKDKFYLDKELSFVNESNMGQGILHYTSSLFHLCVISLRTYLYNSACSKLRIQPGEIRDLVSSDDSYTGHALPMDKIEINRKRIKLFLRSQWITERLMNVWTSKSKSSISLLIYEFNSLFGSNLGVFPTTLKFALSSVQPVNTDSFYRMVKESYNESRQIVENGGSLELYLLAQLLNKKYAEGIYHTHPKGQNDFRLKNIREINMPYHLGVYPVGDPSIMLMLGPEFHNYEIFRRLYEKNDDGSRKYNTSSFSENEVKIWHSSHNMVELNPDVLASLNTMDNLFIGLTRIEAKIGPINKLLSIRRSVDCTWNQILEKILLNPIILFKTPENIEECKLKTYLKLFQNSAAEALRTTAASIYYSRVSATVSAKCFHIPFVTGRMVASSEMDDSGKMVYYDLNNNAITPEEISSSNKTYMDCLDIMLNLPFKKIDPKTFYTYIDEYEILNIASHKVNKYTNKHPLETQNLRQLTLTRIMQRILHPIPSLLYKFWFKKDNFDDMENSEKRDWINLREMTGIFENTYEETIDNIAGDSKEDKIRKLIMIILRLMSHGSSPMKAIIFGPSSKSFETTYNVLNNFNSIYSKTCERTIRSQLGSQESAYYADIYHAYNYFILMMNSEKNYNINHMIDDNKVELLFRDPGVSPSIKKRILLMLIYNNQLYNIQDWTYQTKTIIHNWDKRQIFNKVEKKYFGDYELRLQCGSHIMLCKKKEQGKLFIYSNQISNSMILLELLTKASELLDSKVDDYVKLAKKGTYKITPIGIKNIMTRNGFSITKCNLANIIYQPGDVLFTNDQILLNDYRGNQIMSITKGLIQIDGKPSFTYINFTMDNNIEIKTLYDLGVFSSSFSIESLSSSRCVECLNDLKVNKPIISNFTKQRFDLEDYETYSDEKMLDIILEATGDESKTPDVGFMSSFLIESQEEVEELRAYSETLFSSESKNVSSSYQDNLLNMDINIDLNLISSHHNYSISKPLALWNTVEHLKELLIVRSICDIRKLSTITIKKMSKILADINIFYSLIYVYDKIYKDVTTKSPSFISLQIPIEFMDKFNLI